MTTQTKTTTVAKTNQIHPELRKELSAGAAENVSIVEYDERTDRIHVHATLFHGHRLPAPVATFVDRNGDILQSFKSQTVEEWAEEQ